MRKITLIVLGLLGFALLVQVQGHGKMMEPPARNTMWRFGYKTPKNFNDNELFCGGLTQQTAAGGKCGVCGDPYTMKQPRPNEAGGMYGLGIITRNYTQGQTITVKINLSANHGGHFEFKICPNNNPKKIVEQECLDKYPLELADGSGTKFRPGGRKANMDIDLKLPQGLTCTQCVLQWHYRGGNNWGRCEDGTQKGGCGPQETFRNCADVAINK